MTGPAMSTSAILCVALSLLVACVGSTPSAPAQAGAPDYLSWPQEQSDFKPDPSVRYGVLPNGMHYALMRNAEPQNTASIRLRIAAGSLQETDNQKGLAHFLEHMAFNGSKHFAEGEAVKVLQRKGLAFGPHTNARTGLQETVYILELPTVDDNSIDTALRFMRDVADGLNLDQGAMDRERGVIMSEERQGDSPERRAFNDRWKLTYDGHQAADRLPIGDMQVIRTASHDLIADFYNRYYRPERATLVMVGQFDLDAMEVKIKSGFSDWQRGAQSDGQYGAVSQGTLRSAQHVEPNLPDDVIIAWLSHPDDAPDASSVRRERDIRDIGLAVMNRRLERMARQSEAPFVSSLASRGVLRGVTTVAALFVNARPGRWPQGLAAAEQELHRTLQYGVRQDEIDREIAVFKAQLDDAAAKADTRYDKALADEMIDDLSQRRVFTNPRDDAATYARTVQGLSAATVTEALRSSFAGDPSLIFVSTGQAIAGGSDAVRTAYLSAHGTAVVAEAETKPRDFPYTDFGKAGTVAHREDVADLGVSLVQFANGVRLNVKPTAFEKDTITVKVRFDGGYLALPRKPVGLYWAMPFGFIEGGLKKLTTEELEQTLAGRIANADLSLDEEAFELSGSTNHRDFDLQLQLLAAFAAEPAYRGEGLARLQGAAENYFKQYSSSPGRVLARELSAVVRSNDARWRFPTLPDLQSITMRDVEAVLAPALRSAPIEITIVGDIDVDAAIGAVARTFGTLPQRGQAISRARDVHFPIRGAQLQFTHEGRADQAVAYAGWPGPDFPSNRRQARTVVLMRDIIKVRLNDEFREKQGATYSPFASSWASATIPNFGFVAAGSETPPAQVEAFYKTIDLIVKDLRTGNFDDDLIERARKPIVESALKDRRTNNYWANALESAQTERWTLDAIRSFQNDMEAIRKDEIVAAANKSLIDRRRIEIRVLPKR
jgi:zinc protease